MKQSTSQKGVALISAILIVAIAVVMIAAILSRGELALAHTRNLARAAQAQAYAQGLESWASIILLRDLAQDGPIDSRNDVWAQTAPPFKLPHGELLVSMRDLNGCLNLNDLLLADGLTENTVNLERLKKLLLSLQLDVGLANVIMDWIDKDGQTRADGAEDLQYQLEVPARRTANRAMSDISELRLLRGIDQKIYLKLNKDLCVLPRSSKQNINTMSELMLQTIDPSISSAIATELAQQGSARYMSLDDFETAANASGANLHNLNSLTQNLAVYSEFFEAEALIEIDGIEFRHHFMILRDQKNGGMRVLARWRG